MRLSCWRTFRLQPAASVFRRTFRAFSATALNPDDYRPIGTHRVGCIGIEVPSVVVNEPNVESVVAVLGKAFESGVTLVDICEPQGTLLSAEVVRQALVRHNTAQDIVITGHVGIQNGIVDHSEDSLKFQLEALLGTVGVSSIPLLLLSGLDQKHDWLTAIKTLKSFRDQKLCQMIGVSEVDSSYIKVAINEAGISAVRYPCSVVNREAMANGVLDQCDTNSLALLASRPFGPADQLSKLTHHPVLRQLAEKHDTTPLQICLSWLLLTPCVIPLSPLSSVRIDGASIDLDLNDLELFEKLQTQL